MYHTENRENGGEKETESDREGGKEGEKEVKQAYKLSKPAPLPHPPVMYFLQPASVSESSVTSPGITTSWGPSVEPATGGHFLFKPPQWGRKQD